MAWLGFAILALVLWGITGVTQKLSTNRISSERSFLWFCWAMVALSAAVVVIARRIGRWEPRSPYFRSLEVR